MIIAPHPLQPIVGASQKMTAVFRTWTQQVSKTAVIIGTGTPETVVEAGQGQLFMDDAGIAGAILYVKKQADIGGDRTQGWILV